MNETIVGRALAHAAANAEFRRRALSNPGLALAEEGFVLTDLEMAFLRDCFEPLQHLSERRAYERIAALARTYRTYLP